MGLTELVEGEGALHMTPARRAALEVLDGLTVKVADLEERIAWLEAVAAGTQSYVTEAFIEIRSMVDSVSAQLEARQQLPGV